MKLTKFEIIDHGFDYPDYFPGCGVCLTEYDFVQTGIGETPLEALEDALEQMAFCDDIENLEEIEECSDYKEIEESNLFVTSYIRDELLLNNEDEDNLEEIEESDCHYYISIRYSFARIPADKG